MFLPCVVVYPYPAFSHHLQVWGSINAALVRR